MRVIRTVTCIAPASLPPFGRCEEVQDVELAQLRARSQVISPDL